MDPWCKVISLFIDPFFRVIDIEGDRYRASYVSSCEQLYCMHDCKGYDLVWSILWIFSCLDCDFIWASFWCMQSLVLEKDYVMWRICTRLIYDVMSMAQFLSIVINMLRCCDYVVLKWHVINVIQFLPAMSMRSIGFKLSQFMLDVLWCYLNDAAILWYCMRSNK